MMEAIAIILIIFLLWLPILIDDEEPRK